MTTSEITLTGKDRKINMNDGKVVALREAFAITCEGVVFFEVNQDGSEFKDYDNCLDCSEMKPIKVCDCTQMTTAEIRAKFKEFGHGFN